MCHVCPLNGQRKVGSDGPEDADVVLVGEAPGVDEEQRGRPFVGKSGWALKVRLLAPAGLAKIDESGTWPRVKRLNAFVTNAIMCRPPGNKIDSKEGKRALACCRNSLVAQLKYLESQRARTVVTLGGTSSSIALGREVKIGNYRGRPQWVEPSGLVELSEAEVLKIALRGVKPPEEWLLVKKTIAKIMAWSRSSLRKILKQEAKACIPTKTVSSAKRVRKPRTKRSSTGSSSTEVGTGVTSSLSSSESTT